MCCNPLSPITVNTVARTVVCSNITRKNIRFQNTGISIIFLKKNTHGGSLVSFVDYEVILTPSAGIAEAGEAFETDSIHSFSAISNCDRGMLAIFETETKTI